jgi:hypothetical protein
MMDKNKELKKGEFLNKFFKVIITSSGSDIIAPKPLREKMIGDLDIQSTLNFELANQELSSLSSAEKNKVIRGLIIKNLTSLEMDSLIEDVRGYMKKIIDYTIQNPEYRKELKDLDLDSLLN